MYPTTSAADAYTTTARSTGSPRAAEYQAFQRVTAKLKAAAAMEAQDTNAHAAVAEAVHSNNRLWTVLITDLVDDRNGLPTQLRAQLVSLGDFSRRYGLGAISAFPNTDLAPLIDVNTSVMKGLRGLSAAAG